MPWCQSKGKALAWGIDLISALSYSVSGPLGYFPVESGFLGWEEMTRSFVIVGPQCAF